MFKPVEVECLKKNKLELKLEKNTNMSTKQMFEIKQKRDSFNFIPLDVVQMSEVQLFHKRLFLIGKASRQTVRSNQPNIWFQHQADSEFRPESPRLLSVAAIKRGCSCRPVFNLQSQPSICPASVSLRFKRRSPSDVKHLINRAVKWKSSPGAQITTACWKCWRTALRGCFEQTMKRSIKVPVFTSRLTFPFQEFQNQLQR